MKAKASKSPHQKADIDQTTLQALLEREFGKKQVAVVEWKWTKEQLKQLKKKR